MQTQTNYTTPVATTSWVRWGVRALTALLVLGVVIAGVLYTLGQFGQPSRGATDGRVSAPAGALITNCRPCRDEALAAQQLGQPLIGPASAMAPIASPARSLISTCRVCRDEALGANQTYLTTPEGGAPLLQPDDPRQPGPR
jgi:hypothetical protein